MNITEALNILKPEGNDDTALKAAYRAACKRYHPDINPDGLELMKVINAAYAFLKNNLNKWSYHQATNETPIDTIIAEMFSKVKHFVNVNAEVCGTWLWLTGETWRYKKELKEYGFKWAPKKRAWYWHSEGYHKRSKRVFDLNEIRATFGSIDLESEKLSAIG